MEVYMKGFGNRLNSQKLTMDLRHYMTRLNIYAFNVTLTNNRKTHDKIAFVLFSCVELGERFLKEYGGRTPPTQIKILGRQVYAQRARQAPRDIRLVRSLVTKQIEEERLHEYRLSSRRRQKLQRDFSVREIACGAWQTEPEEHGVAEFNPRYSIKCRGKLRFRTDGIIIHLDHLDDPDEEPRLSYCLIMHYHDMQDISTDSENHLIISLECSPKMYRITPPPATTTTWKAESTRERICGLDKTHELFAGLSLIYMIRLRKSEHHHTLNLSQKGGVPPIEPHTIIQKPPLVPFEISFARLVGELQRSELYPFEVAFQLNAMLCNGLLPPETIYQFLPKAILLVQRHGAEFAGEIFRTFIRNIRFTVDPLHDPKSACDVSLTNHLEDCAKDYVEMYDKEWLRDRSERMAYIRYVMLTPTGVYSYGPQWERQNRVLRKYKAYTDHFLRVHFNEEDGEQFRNEGTVSAHEVYQNFLKRLITDPIVLAGRTFWFLGFSSSSLKSASCWFVSPFTDDSGITMTPEKIIAELGDFKPITIPGRLAARVGQTFSDTINTVQVPVEHETEIEDIERRDSSGTIRNFSDGVGKVSGELVKRIWGSSNSLAKARETVFQIRHGGAKGVIALDSTLVGAQLCLRKSMKKFTGSNDRFIEICSTAKRMPVLLNRPLVKLLEDLRVLPSTFMDLQETEVQRLRNASKSAFQAANFFKRQNSSSPTLKLHWIVESLYKIGIDFWDDELLKRGFELSLLAVLRAVKYKARIPVHHGVTLMGIVDETNVLKEGEVHCTYEEDGKKEVIEGRVMITRSPVYHPGDVQMVNAVKAPQLSPLRALKNCVVFSQQGDRPLPSMLSGGDLDGDIYNIITDPRFSIQKTYPAAKFPPPDPPKPLDKPVTQEDIARFFIDFMQNDLLGMISTRHLQFADHEELGVFHPACIKLAEFASIAVDFPKTGKPVPKNEIPRLDTKAKPDFLAPGPRVLVAKDELLHDGSELHELEDEDEEYFVPQLYYESQKVLGKLYRAIDENQFLQEVHANIDTETAHRKGTALKRVWEYMEIHTEGEQDWVDYLQEASDFRGPYESELAEIMICASDTPWKSRVTEVEVFIGVIIGNGGTNKRHHRQCEDMRDAFDSLVRYTINGLRKETRRETLGLAMACLRISLPESTNPSQTGCRSFAWIAIYVLMVEVDRMQKERKAEAWRKARTALPVGTTRRR